MRNGIGASLSLSAGESQRGGTAGAAAVLSVRRLGRERRRLLVSQGAVDEGRRERWKWREAQTGRELEVSAVEH